MIVKAEKLYNSVDRCFSMPACVYMSHECQWQLAYLYNKQLLLWKDLTLNSLCEWISSLKTWSHWTSSGFILLQYLQSIVSEINHVYTELLKKKRHAREIKTAVKQAAKNQQTSQTTLTTANEYAIYIHQRDNALTTQIARQEAWKTVKATDNLSMPLPGISAISLPATSVDLQCLQHAKVIIVNSQLKCNLNNNNLQTDIQNNDIDIILKSQADNSQNAVLKTQLACSDASQILLALIILLSDIQSSLSSTSHDQKRRGSTTLQNQDVTPSKHQTSLTEIDSNVCRTGGLNLWFMLTSSSGWVQYLTEKEKENFCICW